MQAEWGKRKKREKKEGKQGGKRDSGRMGRLLIAFRIVNFRRPKTEGFEQKKSPASSGLSYAQYFSKYSLGYKS